MLKKSTNLLLIIFLINSVNFYCQNKKIETFLVGFKVDCLIEKNPFFESQNVYLTDIENNSEGSQYIFYSNGNKYKVKMEEENLINDHGVRMEQTIRIHSITLLSRDW